MEAWELQQMQGLPLEAKIIKSKKRIQEWFDYWGGNVYVSFSDGKDSTVLLHIARSIYPNIKAVFIDTGLEYPEQNGELLRYINRPSENVVLKAIEQNPLAIRFVDKPSSKVILTVISSTIKGI